MRLLVLGVLVVALMGTLLARLVFLQVLSADTYRAAANSQRTREVVTPAVRGLIVDQAGRPLVGNRISLVVSIDRSVLDTQKDDGAAELAALSPILNISADDLAAKMTLCGTEDAAPTPICWNGSPFQPVPVIRDVTPETALRVMERSAEFPGVKAQLEAVREYPTPYGANLAHSLGYVGPVTKEMLDAQGDSTDVSRLRNSDLVGRTGLEAYYDKDLRGIPGIKTLSVDPAGRVTGTVSEVQPTPGNYVVSTVDAHLQSVVEQQLRAAVERARSLGNPGDSGAAVVIDVKTGAVLALASYPTYDPSVWVGGITSKDYQSLVDSGALTATAVQGTYAPGSTFKVVTTAAAGREGFDLNATYDCPSEISLGSQVFRNSESSSYGPIPLKRAIEVSCNTVFYSIADQLWLAAGGGEAATDAPDPIADAARMFGLGQPTGLDLPDEKQGRIGSRLYKLKNWETNKDAWCKSAQEGYPDTRKTDPAQADFYTQLDKENCIDGFRWREGDALNSAIGQGDTAVTPLQLAMVYSAIANGGTVYQPRMVKGIVSSTGQSVRDIGPIVKGKLDVPASTMAFLHDALPGVTTEGTGRIPFEGFPLDKIPVASKTGSAQVAGKAVSTSWFASYAPANNPQYAVVMMVTQGGTGSGTSGPSVRKIYESLFGVDGTSVDPSKSILIGGAPTTEMPTVLSDGTPQAPEEKIPARLPSADLGGNLFVPAFTPVPPAKLETPVATP